jgi:hypothetical protein
MKVNIQAAGL